MSYFDRQIRKKLYEQKLGERKKSQNNSEVPSSEQKYYQVTFSTDGINYNSNVIVQAINEKEASTKVINRVNVKPHVDSEMIVRQRDKSFVDDYVGRGMNLIEDVQTDTLGNDAIKAVKRILEVGLRLVNQKDSPMTLNELDKIVGSLMQLRDSIKESGDFLTEDFVGEMPETPKEEEDTGVSSMLNTLITEELSAVDSYNGAIQTLKSLNKDYKEIIDVLTNIAGEENIHIGQLQRVSQLVNPQAELSDNGVEEAEETLTNHK